MQIPAELEFRTSTIADGNMSLRFGELATVRQNRRAFVGHDNFVCMKCDHGVAIVPVREPAAEQLPAEVLVTQTPGLTLMLLTADCLPAAFYDPVTRTIALAHHSRQTIAAGLPTQVVTYLTESFAVDPVNVQVLVGPHIHAASYRFPNTGEEFSERIEPFVVRTESEAIVDLPAAHTAELAAAGVPKENISYASVNTFASPEHFSHFESTRNDQKPHGRLATTLTLNP